MDYISEIKALAQEGKRIDPDYKIFGADHHKWQFGKIVDMQKIRDFEHEMKIVLPEPFVRYLTELGDGGAGPYYGIYSLDKIKKSNDFLGRTEQLPVMLDHSLTDEQWKRFARKYEELDEKFSFDTEEEQRMNVQEIERMELSLLSGGIIINTPGCTMKSLLMCRGAAKGEVFNIDFDYIFELQSEPFCYGGFEDWVIDSMRRALKC